MSSTSDLSLHPDRLLPSEPVVRSTARELYESVKDLPIISPHGHVPPQWLSEDIPFSDPTSLLITPDHYVNRMLHASGVELSALGVAQDTMTEQQSRDAFRILCSHWGVYRGTHVRYWLDDQLAGIFGVKVRPSAETADQIYDQIASCLGSPEFKPRALYEKFKIEVLATTDDPCDDLSAHQFLRNDGTWQGRVIPTFRPDKYLEPAQPNWNADVDRLAEVSGIDTGDYDGYIAVMENRRKYFKDNGAVSADHSHLDARTDTLEVAEAERIYASARKGEASEVEATVLRRHLVSEMARMACDDGLVMTLHPGVRRNHHMATFEKYGADVWDLHSSADGVHRSSAPDVDALRDPSQLPVGDLYHRRNRVLQRDRAARWLLPICLCRRSLVVHRCARGDPPLPCRDHRDCRLRQVLRLHR
jgi:glucuronate isomerase